MARLANRPVASGDALRHVVICVRSIDENAQIMVHVVCRRDVRLARRVSDVRVGAARAGRPLPLVSRRGRSSRLS